MEIRPWQLPADDDASRRPMGTSTPAAAPRRDVCAQASAVPRLPRAVECPGTHARGTHSGLARPGETREATRGSVAGATLRGWGPHVLAGATLRGRGPHVLERGPRSFSLIGREAVVVWNPNPQTGQELSKCHHLTVLTLLATTIWEDTNFFFPKVIILKLLLNVLFCFFFLCVHHTHPSPLWKQLNSTVNLQLKKKKRQQCTKFCCNTST